MNSALAPRGRKGPTKICSLESALTQPVSDLPKLEGEYNEAGPVADAVRGTQVGTERRLTIRSRPHEVEPPARTQNGGLHGFR